MPRIPALLAVFSVALTTLGFAQSPRRFQASDGQAASASDTGRTDSVKARLLEAKERFAQADQSYRIGRWTALGGLALSLTPNLIGINESGDFDVVSGLGLIAFLGAVPYTGQQAVRMRNAAQAMHPDYRPPGSGWLYFDIGLGLETVGMFMYILEAIQKAADVVAGAETDHPVFDAAPVPIAIGFGAQVFAWYKFGRLRASALQAAEPSFSLAPMLLRERNRLAPGLALACHF